MVNFKLHIFYHSYKNLQAKSLAYPQELQRTTTFGRNITKRGSWLSIFLKIVVVFFIRSIGMPVIVRGIVCPAMCCELVWAVLRGRMARPYGGEPGTPRIYLSILDQEQIEHIFWKNMTYTANALQMLSFAVPGVTLARPREEQMFSVLAFLFSSQPSPTPRRHGWKLL